MIRHFCAFLFLIFSSACFGQNTPEIQRKSSFSIGEVLEFQSTVLQEKRRINVYLPESYSSDSSKAYPVIYLLDGSKDEDFIHVSGIVQFGSFPWINTLPESIVVGIENVDRKRDFTFPTTNKADLKEFSTSGKSEKFIEFIEQELQPLIASTYRTQANKTLIGQSLGGLLATEILFNHPELFDQYVIVSPSLWWNDESLLSASPKNAALSKAIYLAVGKEGEVMERTAQELFNKLSALAPENESLFFDFLPNKTHGDALHQAVYNAFECLKNVR